MLCISAVLVVNFSFFISKFVDLNPLLYFFMILAKGLSILFIFSKNQLLVYWFLLLFSSFLFHFFLLSSLSFIPSSKLWWRQRWCYWCSFSSCFRCKVRLRFLLFLEVRLNFRYRFNMFSLSDSVSFLCDCFNDKEVRVLKGGRKKKWIMECFWKWKERKPCILLSRAVWGAGRNPSRQCVE